MDILGSGKNARAVIYKGMSFAVRERLTVAGHVFQIYDQDGNRVPKAMFYMDQQNFATNDRGEVSQGSVVSSLSFLTLYFW